jgi:polyhydroxyalkanoate synthesis regulator phasin
MSENKMHRKKVNSKLSTKGIKTSDMIDELSPKGHINKKQVNKKRVTKELISENEVKEPWTKKQWMDFYDKKYNNLEEIDNNFKNLIDEILSIFNVSFLLSTDI